MTKNKHDDEPSQRQEPVAWLVTKYLDGVATETELKHSDFGADEQIAEWTERFHHWAISAEDRSRLRTSKVPLYATPPPIAAAKVEVVEGWTSEFRLSVHVSPWDNTEFLESEWPEQVAILRRADYEALIARVAELGCQLSLTSKEKYK